jgi:hypothetical protein
MLALNILVEKYSLQYIKFISVMYFKKKYAILRCESKLFLYQPW